MDNTMDNAALTAHATALQPTLLARYTAAAEAAATAAGDVNRLALAQILLDADLPAEAVIEVIDWAEEPNGDGTFDMDVTEAYIPDGDSLGDLGGQGAVNAGRYTGGNAEDGHSTETDWDPFMVEGRDDLVSVAKVYDWLRAQNA